MEHLIPQEWFVGFPQLVLLGFVAASLGILAKGADWLVEGAAGTAYRFGLPKVIVGATIVSLGTTSPEFAVSVMAAWAGQPGLALGNAVGSIIADSGLIFGLGCLLAVLPADRFVLNRQGRVQFGSAVLLALFCYAKWAFQGESAAIGRAVGIIFLVLLLAYMWISVRWSRGHMVYRAEVAEGEEETEEEPRERESVFQLVWHMIVGLVMVILGSHVLICSVTVLAERWGVPQVVIAGTIVALGTSLPELVIGMTSVAKGHRELLVGNIIGADILNVLFVVGGSAVAARLPIIDPESKIPAIFLYLHLPAMLLILFLFRIFIRSAVKRGEFRRWQGLPLLLIYLLFVFAPYLIARH